MKTLMLEGPVYPFYDNFNLKKVSDFLAEIPKDEKFEVYINSPGGSVTEGTAIYTLLAERNSHCTIKIIGMAGSIASVVAMAAGKVMIADVATMYLHKPLSMMWGNSGEAIKLAEELDRYEKAITRAYTGKSGKTEKQIGKILAEERTFLAEECLELGLVDEVYEPTKSEKARAEMYSGAQNQVYNIVAMQQAKIDVPIEKVEKVEEEDGSINNDEGIVTEEQKQVILLQGNLETANSSIESLRSEKLTMQASLDKVTAEATASVAENVTLKKNLETANATITANSLELNTAEVENVMAKNQTKILPAIADALREELIMLKNMPDQKFADGTTMYARKVADIEKMPVMGGLNDVLPGKTAPPTAANAEVWDPKVDDMTTPDGNKKFLKICQTVETLTKCSREEAMDIVMRGDGSNGTE